MKNPAHIPTGPVSDSAQLPEPGVDGKAVVSYIGDAQQYVEPKEQFKLILRLIRRDFGDQPIALMDAGCAAGGFLHHARAQLNVTRAVGTDVDEECLVQARERVFGVEFLYDSLVAPTFMATAEFDVCTCLTVLSYLDDLALPLRTLLSYVRPGGRLYIMDFVNHFPIDVIMRYRYAEHGENAPWAAGLNMRSQVTYERTLRAIDPNVEIAWTRFEMPFAIPRTSDPMRAWTIATEDSPFQGTVGTGALLFYQVATVTVPANLTAFEK